MTEKMIVNYCMPCEIVYNTTHPQTTCAICQGTLKEIGWVEQNG
jgi:hypothetical protein